MYKNSVTCSQTVSVVRSTPPLTQVAAARIVGVHRRVEHEAQSWVRPPGSTLQVSVSVVVDGLRTTGCRLANRARGLHMLKYSAYLEKNLMTT